MSAPQTSAPSEGRARESAAALWAARSLRGQLKPKERAAREAWLQEEPGNRAAYECVLAAHELAQQAASMPEIMAIRREALEAGPEVLPRRYLRWAVAAVALLAIGLASALMIQNAGLTSPRAVASVEHAPRAAPRDHFETGVGERLSATLSDGSVITLNTATEVRVRYSASARRIELVRGQALFNVAHEPERPFLVEAGGRSVRALGTAFEVRRKDDGIDVLLIDGTVAVGEVGAMREGDLSQAVRMQAGERLVAASANYEIAPANVERLTAWTSGRLIFSATRLDAAVAEINRYRERPLLIEDPEIAALEISGAYRIADAANFGSALSPTLPVREERLPDGRARLVFDTH